MTVGVISATNRRLQSPQGDWLYELVQTDAPISPGSSGGALVDSRGAVVGITTVIAVTDVGAEGLGFATPIEIARDVAKDIIQWGRPRHGRLGIRGSDAQSIFYHQATLQECWFNPSTQLARRPLQGYKWVMCGRIEWCTCR